MQHARGNLDLQLGSGERLASLRPYLARAALLVDLGELAGSRPVRLVLDAELLPLEDLGLLRRFLARSSESELWLVGEDASRRAVRVLLRLPRVHWLSWPPDIDDLRALAAPPEAAPTPERAPTLIRAAAPGSSEPRAAPSQATLEADEIAEIEAILSEIDAPLHARASESSESVHALEPIEPEQATEREFEPVSTAHAVVETPAALPGYFREQVADLADIAQRIELSLENLREGAQEDDASAFSTPLSERIEETASEVGRLVQFTRTLSYLAAPPAQGTQVFDLTELVEVFLSGQGAKGPEAPRCLFRGGGALPVRSDRSLLTQALDALFFVATRCAAHGELVRVLTRAEEHGGRAFCVVQIEFSPGPLAELEPAAMLAPYGLRRSLPELGPNALTAASNIVLGQGGSVALVRAPSGRLRWQLELPRHATRANGKPAPHEDPFA